MGSSNKPAPVTPAAPVVQESQDPRAPRRPFDPEGGTTRRRNRISAGGQTLLSGLIPDSNKQTLLG